MTQEKEREQITMIILILMTMRFQDKEPEPETKPKFDQDQDPDQDPDQDEFQQPFFLIIWGPPTDQNPKKKQKTTKSAVIKCVNPCCNHMTFEQDPLPAPELYIENIESINDLITLSKAFSSVKSNYVPMILNLRIMCKSC